MLKLDFTFRGEALSVELEEGGAFRLAHRDGTGHAIISGSWGPALKLQEVHCHADKVDAYFVAALQAFASVKPAPLSLDRWGKEASFDVREIERLRRENKNGGYVITQVALALGGTMTDLPSMLRRITRLKQRAFSRTGTEFAASRLTAKIRRKGRPLGATGRWTRTVELFKHDGWSDVEKGEGLGVRCGLGIIRHRSQHFLSGDVVLIGWMNGSGCRQPVWCRTGRGHEVRNYYMQYARYPSDRSTPWGDSLPDPNRGEPLRDRTALKVVEHPGHLEGLPPDDPAVRRFVVETLCAGDAAPG
jgi:hypothetical protein